MPVPAVPVRAVTFAQGGVQPAPDPAMPLPSKTFVPAVRLGLRQLAGDGATMNRPVRDVAPVDGRIAAGGGADVALATAARHGDPEARRRLLDGLADLPAMLRVKNARLGAPLRGDELDDALQNVLLSLWSKLDRFDGRVPLLHWAYGFGVVEIRRTIERRGRRRERSLDGETVDHRASGSHGDPDRLRAAVAGLDPDEQAVVRLKHFEALTFDEIAARLGVAANTAKSRYYRGLDRLRRRLRPMEEP
jgi:RNA polymerase sigma-70 factor (ECF subfamily)